MTWQMPTIPTLIIICSIIIIRNAKVRWFFITADQSSLKTIRRKKYYKSGQLITKYRKDFALCNFVCFDTNNFKNVCISFNCSIFQVIRNMYCCLTKVYQLSSLSALYSCSWSFTWFTANTSQFKDTIRNKKKTKHYLIKKKHFTNKYVLVCNYVF